MTKGGVSFMNNSSMPSFFPALLIPPTPPLPQTHTKKKSSPDLFFASSETDFSASLAQGLVNLLSWKNPGAPSCW